MEAKYQEEVANLFWNNKVEYAKDIDNDEIQKIHKAIVHAWDSSLANIIKCGHKELSIMARLCWMAINRNVVKTICDLSGKIDRLYVMVIGNSKNDPRKAAVMLPINWHLQVANDQLTQQGGVVFCSSQIIDYCNGLTNQQDMEERAYCWEAEYFNHCKQKEPLLVFNKFQKHVVDVYKGIEHCKHRYKWYKE